VFGTRYSDVRLLGRIATGGSLWPVAGLAWHCASGAFFGIAFERLGGSGWKQGVLAAELENVALWPLAVLVDRFHPDVREGRLPPIARDGRVFAQEVVAHAIFGAVLGGAVTRT
jgi:hypothetical protein